MLKVNFLVYVMAQKLYFMKKIDIGRRLAATAAGKMRRFRI